MTPSHGVSTRPRAGELVNGDAALVRPYASGILFAVVDGLGHGDGAHAAARAALDFLGRPDLEGGPEWIMHGLDGALKGTRGAAALVGVLIGGFVSCCAVGNVDVRTQGVRLPVTLTAGIVGRGLRRTPVFGGALVAGCRLVVFSDGVSGRFVLAETIALPPETASGAILASHGRTTDDATVLVVDVR